MIKLILHTIILLAPVMVLGQKLSATLNHEQILVGEPVKYTLRIETSPKSKISFTPSLSVISCKLQNKDAQVTTSKTVDLEILTAFKDTLIRNKTQDVWIGTYMITCWDSGTVILPEAMVVVNDSTFYFPESRLSCSLVPQIKNQDLYDIRESFADVPEPKSKLRKFLEALLSNAYWWLPLALVLAFVWIQLKRHKKAARPIKKVKETSLKDKTILAIEALEKQKMWEKGKLKDHYVELSYIMRSYLSSRYEVNFLEKTTIETRLLLRQVGLHPETIDGLMTILNQSDMVKFAKSQPDEITILKVSMLAKQIVAETSPIEFENAE